MKREDVAFLKQLVESLDSASAKLEVAYRENDVEQLNKIKRFILKIQDQISEVMK